MYVENVVTVMKRELLDECDYVREAECNLKFAQLLKDGINRNLVFLRIGFEKK